MGTCGAIRRPDAAPDLQARFLSSAHPSPRAPAQAGASSGRPPARSVHRLDSLGWVYQFWQAKKKDEVNTSEVKIGAKCPPSPNSSPSPTWSPFWTTPGGMVGGTAALRGRSQNAGSERGTAPQGGPPRDASGIPPLRPARGRPLGPCRRNFRPLAGKNCGLQDPRPCCGSGHFLSRRS